MSISSKSPFPPGKYIIRWGSCNSCNSMSTKLVKACACDSSYMNWHSQEQCKSLIKFNDVASSTRELIDEHDKEFKPNADAKSPNLRSQIVEDSNRRITRKNRAYKHSPESIKKQLQQEEEKRRRDVRAVLQGKKLNTYAKKNAVVKKLPGPKLPGPYDTIRLRHKTRDSGSPPSSPTPIVKKTLKK